jgi:hypothetical protein
MRLRSCRSLPINGTPTDMPAPDQPAEEDEALSLVIGLFDSPGEHVATDVSQRVGDFCEARFRDPDVRSRLHMAAHELAENVGKYATSSGASLQVELEPWRDDACCVSIRTRNQAAPTRLAEAVRRLDEVMRARDPVALYDRLIEESPPVEGVSGLGLARIKAEGGLDFDYAISGNELTVVARGRFPKPRSPEVA